MGRAPLLGTAQARNIFEQTFEQTRQWYGFYLAGYVVMPEHVHLLMSEPERAKLSVALQMLKQNVARRLRSPEGGLLWQPRYYDFNVWSEAKRIEKLRYIHRNPVKRGLVQSPDDWAWSSFRHYVSGFEGVVEIESQWTARKRERMGVVVGIGSQNPRPVSAQNADTKDGPPSRFEMSERVGQPPVQQSSARVGFRLSTRPPNRRRMAMELSNFTEADFFSSLGRCYFDYYGPVQRMRSHV